MVEKKVMPSGMLAEASLPNGHVYSVELRDLGESLSTTIDRVNGPNVQDEQRMVNDEALAKWIDILEARSDDHTLGEVGC
jgi:hypothetical protein